MTSVSAHLRPSSIGPAPAPAASPWSPWSAAWTTQAALLTSRPDARVTVTPAAGGPPGFSYPATADIQVDADLIGDPEIADPCRPGHRSKVPVAYGVLLHECAHVIHSKWDPPPTVAPVVREAALLLEESRIEGRYRDTRSRDRRWLRRAVTSIIDPADTPTDTKWSAAYAAGLLLARVDAKILYSGDVREPRRAITKVLGRKLIRGLRAIWREAHTVGDTDTTRMIELGERWCRLLGIDPTVTPSLPADDAATSAIAAAIAGALDAILTNPADAPEPAGNGPRADGPGIHVDTDTPITWAERDARDAERQAANRLTALLRRARHREPARTREPSSAPPGRLRTRAAVTLAAQRASGAIPTAQPWQRTVRRPVPDPELTVGILIDASGSMEDFAKPMSSAAWIIAQAATRAGATSATLAYGDRITVLIPPGRRPAKVRDMRADAGTERFVEACAEADRLLHLSTPGTGRLLVVVSDGHYVNPDESQATITRLHHAGCAVLWLAPDNKGWPSRVYDNTTTVTVDDPTTCMNLIGQAAIDALTRA
ncbi:VWA domain containing CoxE-like protein [Micromonospora sp. M71_S20]|uniref:VWA domain-containing protein n=1 Tax=Micromonospora sp. M71_S20 TaxID=592872 RepID=UPI000F1575B7|nr:VWA domain-containing protein [Micromonospora sp. M71_S20]RLK24730.1 VWA domain containing CoxE-like protein [Micromonospora sp. M71_S20]